MFFHSKPISKWVSTFLLTGLLTWLPKQAIIAQPLDNWTKWAQPEDWVIVGTYDASLAINQVLLHSPLCEVEYDFPTVGAQLTTVDSDADNQDEIVVLDVSNNLVVYELNGENSDPHLLTDTKIFQVKGDLDGDSNREIIIGSKAANDVIIIGDTSFEVFTGIPIPVTTTRKGDKENSNQGQVFEELFTGEESAVYADSAYKSKAPDELLENQGIPNGVRNRPYRNPPLTDEPKRHNRYAGQVRYVVERTFGVLKRYYGLAKAKYLGIKRNQACLTISSMAPKLKRAVSIPRASA